MFDFTSKVKNLSRKMFLGNFLQEPFCVDHRKDTKIANIRTCKTLAPHGMLCYSVTTLLKFPLCRRQKISFLQLGSTKNDTSQWSECDFDHCSPGFKSGTPNILSHYFQKLPLSIITILLRIIPNKSNRN